jgi:uncharacterized protein
VAADNVIRLRPVRPCPICGKPSTQTFHPFCSKRCAEVDLGRWLGGAYVIPGKPIASDEEDRPDLASDADDDV